MSIYFAHTAARMAYVDRHELLRSRLTEEAFRTRRQVQLDRSTTVYVGNLSFYTTEQQLKCHFECCGHIRDIVTGLKDVDMTPCGFCFIVFETIEAATMAVEALNGSVVDDRAVRVGWDVGCDASRRWGRGAHGGQVVDRVRQTVDEARGGLGGLRRDAVGVGSAVVDGELVVYKWVSPRLTRQNAGARQQHAQAQQRKRALERRDNGATEGEAKRRHI